MIKYLYRLCIIVYEVLIFIVKGIDPFKGQFGLLPIIRFLNNFHVGGKYI